VTGTRSNQIPGREILGMEVREEQSNARLENQEVKSEKK
jgi:hypothetical protein